MSKSIKIVIVTLVFFIGHETVGSAQNFFIWQRKQFPQAYDGKRDYEERKFFQYDSPLVGLSGRPKTIYCTQSVEAAGAKAVWTHFLVTIDTGGQVTHQLDCQKDTCFCGDWECPIVVSYTILSTDPDKMNTDASFTNAKKAYLNQSLGLPDSIVDFKRGKSGRLVSSFLYKTVDSLVSIKETNILADTIENPGTTYTYNQRSHRIVQAFLHEYAGERISNNDLDFVFQYDPLGRVQLINLKIGGIKNGRVRFEYNAHGDPTSIGFYDVSVDGVVETLFGLFTYTYAAYDESGNWTQREIVEEPKAGKDPDIKTVTKKTQMRRISYY